MPKTKDMHAVHSTSSIGVCWFCVRTFGAFFLSIQLVIGLLRDGHGYIIYLNDCISGFLILFFHRCKSFLHPSEGISHIYLEVLLLFLTAFYSAIISPHLALFVVRVIFFLSFFCKIGRSAH